MTKASVNNTPDEKDLELINAYTRNPLTKEDIYCFNLTLCDNEVDRDFERFSVDALKELCDLFPGKTGICDHDMSSKNQKARIFKTWLEEDKNKKTSTGESYVALKATAYTLRTEENRELIAQIEGGIKKEVSVGCSMKNLTCSICSKDMKHHECNHIKGKYYGKNLCHGILSSANDAYEWSFVAVPAQKNAGVTKTFSKEQKKKTTVNPDTTEKAVYSAKYICEIENLAKDGLLYKEFLAAEIKKYALIVMPRVNAQAFLDACKNMNAHELKGIMEGLRSQASEFIPVSLQLKPLSDKKTVSNNNVFKI